MSIWVYEYFVGTLRFLREALWAAMETMNFHIAQTSLLWGPIKQFALYDKMP